MERSKDADDLRSSGLRLHVGVGDREEGNDCTVETESLVKEVAMKE